MGWPGLGSATATAASGAKPREAGDLTLYPREIFTEIF